MRTYELVCVIDTVLSSVEIKDLKGRIEKHITTHAGEIKATDEMGLMPLAYPLKGQDQGYIVSYHIQIDPDQLTEAKTELKLLKGLAKFFFYGMKDSDEFLLFGDLQKKYDAIYPVVEEDLEDDLDEDAEEADETPASPTEEKPQS